MKLNKPNSISTGTLKFFITCIFCFFPIVFLPSLCSGQQHTANCWLENDSGYATSFFGTQPALADIQSEMSSLATKYNVPIEIIAAVCYQESGLYQYDANDGYVGFVIHNKTECENAFYTGYISGATTPPPGLGLMQLTSTTATSQFDVNRLISDWAYNLEAGVQILVQKYNNEMTYDPAWMQTFENQNRNVLENWYYALAAYNGSSSYINTIYGLISSPQPRITGIFTPVSVNKPTTIIPGFTYGGSFVATASGTWYDVNGNQYSGTVHLTGNAQLPAMSLTYNGTAIPNGDSSPSAAKGTDFGSVTDVIGSSTRTFTINNTGNASLNLTGTPRIQFSGSNPSDFGMTAQPSTPVSVSGSTTFTIIFQPESATETGLKTATITIPNDDPNKNPYTFMIQGTAQVQQRIDPSLEYSGVTINEGDQSPTASKGTDFGSANVGSSTTHSFQFYNYGNINMNLTGSFVQLSGANSGDFAVTTMPSSPITPNQYSTIGIQFQPTGSGLRTASLLIYFDATYGLGATSPYTVALQGTGVQTTVSVTVQPNPLSGPSYTVDGALWYGSTPFNWNAGSGHTISTTTPQNVGNPIITKRFVWSSWSDGGAISHTVNPTISTTYTANFTTQYFLSMAASAGGTVSPVSDWHDSGTAVSISATPNSGYSFMSWTGSGSGSYSGNNNPASVTMNESITEIPNFTLIPVPTISNPKLAGTIFTVSVPTQVGFNYILEYKNSLGDVSWTAAQTIGGTGGTITLTDTTATGSSRLYHVRVQ